MEESVLFYVILFVILDVFVRIIWDITVTHKKERKEHQRQLKRMFQLGMHEGSNQMYSAQRPEHHIDEHDFEYYLKLDELFQSGDVDKYYEFVNQCKNGKS